MSEKDILEAIRRALAVSIREGDTERICQQGRALVLAMKDYITALEKELVDTRLRERYNKGA